MTMKKLALASAILAASILPAKADVLGIYVGAQIWQNEADGGFSQDSNTLADFSFDEETNANVYIKFEHPLPLIPNARVRLGKLEGNGSANLTDDFNFGDTTFDGSVNTKLDFTNNDATLYWELLDNDIIGFDFGLTVKNIDGDFIVENDTVGQSTENVSVWIPMAYAAVKVRIPFAGLYAYGDANVISYDGSDIHDYEVGIGYDLIDNIAVDVALTAGYREVAIELDDVDNISADLEFSGFFAGLEVHF